MDEERSGSRFLVFWVVTVATLVGPWLLLRFGVAGLFGGTESAAIAEGGYRLREAIDGWYPWVLGAYLTAAYFLTPTWDREKLGLFGSRWIDNPFSYEDDWNRNKQTLAYLLVPGKIVWVTLGETWQRISAKARAEA